MITPAEKKQEDAADAKYLAAESRREAARAKLRSAFLAAQHAGDTPRSVALLLPLVRGLLMDSGIDGDSLNQQVDRLVGQERAGYHAGGDWQKYCDALGAAYALGLAMGQQLTPGFFEKGGAR